MNVQPAHYLFAGDHSALGVGCYTPAEAGRLLNIPVRNINRWLGGYSFSAHGQTRSMPPLWESELPKGEGGLELGFKDLIELRFVQAFLDVGLSLHTLRRCLAVARAYVEEERPFSTRRFRTDGSTIFLDTARQSGESELLDLKRKQFAMGKVIEASFKDLDIDAGSVVRWRPYKGKDSIVIDPKRSFGQPIASLYGVPTVTLADAVEAEGSEKRVSRLFEVPIAAVRDAVRFENALRGA